jgi:hypothetical protein
MLTFFKNIVVNKCTTIACTADRATAAIFSNVRGGAHFVDFFVCHGWSTARPVKLSVGHGKIVIESLKRFVISNYWQLSSMWFKSGNGCRVFFHDIELIEVQ